MSKTAEELSNKIKNKIERNGSEFDSWFASIADDDVKKKLFEEHNVNELNGIWIYLTAETAHQAKEIVKNLHNLGVHTNESDCDDKGLIVFAYKKTPSTNP